ncbi:MAG: hypothetical protein RSA02_04370 [Bacteroidales bacterium]
METYNLNYVISTLNNGEYMRAELLINSNTYYSKPYRYTVIQEKQCINYCACSLCYNVLKSMCNQRRYALEAARRKYGLPSTQLILLDRLENWISLHKKVMDFLGYSKLLKPIMTDLVYPLLPGVNSSQRSAFIYKYIFIQSLMLSFDIRHCKNFVKREYPRDIQMTLDF